MASASDDVEPTISLQEYVESQQDQEEAANAVLGNSDPTNCSFSKGYMKRQALYSCATCYDRNIGYAGICLACSLDCHDGHELFELYTKRNFRCDCGNSKMTTRCKLEPNRPALNSENYYKSNFDGLYCTCKRPYPDPEVENEEEMIQCCVCEDWLHSNHLNLTSEIPADYDEMICYQCILKYPLLQCYNLNHSELKTESTSMETPSTVSDVKTEVSDVNTGLSNVKSEMSNVKSEVSDIKSKVSDVKTEPTDDKLESNDCKTESVDEKLKPGLKNSDNSDKEELTVKVEVEATTIETKLKLDCKKPQGNISSPETSFYKDDWRSRLCICEECQTAMKDIEFLYDNEDSVSYYESQNSSSPQSLHDQGMNALSSLNRPQMIEMVQGYTDMKTELSDYLKKFADDRKVISKEDIQQFFEEFTQSKRRRLHLPPNSCK